ncbi:hypothetical protein [Leptotrichia trevisanii]|uniref:hypothetical protein n=1 Tax=Leptotrichia trevisanii TaxID=109328 RepID=UPI00041DABCC|nr:hypothetical protein [Leptotrichia trevisanii]
MFGVNKPKISHIKTIIEEKKKYNSNYFYKKRFPTTFIIIILIIPITSTGIIKYFFSNVDFFKTWISTVFLVMNLSIFWVYWCYSKRLKSKLKLGKNEIVDFYDDRVLINNRINNLFKEYIDSNYIIKLENIDELLKELENEINDEINKWKKITTITTINFSLVTPILSVVASQYFKINEKFEWINFIIFIAGYYFFGYCILVGSNFLRKKFLKEVIDIGIVELIEIKEFLLIKKNILELKINNILNEILKTDYRYENISEYLLEEDKEKILSFFRINQNESNERINGITFNIEFDYFNLHEYKNNNEESFVIFPIKLKLKKENFENNINIRIGDVYSFDFFFVLKNENGWNLINEKKFIQKYKSEYLVENKRKNPKVSSFLIVLFASIISLVVIWINKDGIRQNDVLDKGLKKYTLNNSTDKEIKIKLDTTADYNYILESYSSKKITLKAGEHSIEKNDGTKCQFTINPDSEIGIIDLKSCGVVNQQSQFKSFPKEYDYILTNLSDREISIDLYLDKEKFYKLEPNTLRKVTFKEGKYNLTKNCKLNVEFNSKGGIVTFIDSDKCEKSYY